MTSKAVIQPVDIVENDGLRNAIIANHDPCKRRRRRTSGRGSEIPVKTVSKKPRSTSSNVIPIPGEIHHMDNATSSTDMHIDEVAQKEIYTELLVRYGAISRLGNEVYLMQDFDHQTNSLKEKFLILKKKVLQDKEGVHHLYACPCDPAREDVILHLLSTIEDNWASNSCKEECLHIQAIQLLIKANPESHMDIDNENANCKQEDHPYGKKEDEIEIYGLQSSDYVIVVRVNQSYSVVMVKCHPEAYLYCEACHSKGCRHVKVIKERLDQHPSVQDILENKQIRSRYVPYCRSQQPISFLKPMTDTHDLFNLSQAIPADDGHCTCGHPWAVDIQHSHDAMIFTDRLSHPIEVFYRKCSSETCDNVKHYDGSSDGVMNMHSYLISHSVLRAYMRQFLTDGTTLISYYKEWTWQQVENGNSDFNDNCSYYRFRYAWYAFLHLMHIHYEEGFSCPKCNQDPDLIVMDGVSLGLKKQFLKWHMPDNQKTQLDGSHNERILIPGLSCRKAIKNFAVGKEDCSQAKFAELKKEVNLYFPELNVFLNECEESGWKKCPPQYQEILLAISSPYPASALIPIDASIINIIELESVGGNFRKNLCYSQQLENQAPYMYHMLSEFSHETPTNLRPVLASLALCVRKFLEVKEHDLKIDEPDTETMHTDHEFFPALRKINKRGQYVLDNKTSEVGQCRKQSGRHPSLTPGLFTMSCAHGVCYGFSLMENSESPNIPFTLMRTRFKQAPSVVIYDNACNLHVYCMNRDPGFFRNTKFLVDRFHWPNHKACHQGYNLSQHKKLHEVNSQVAEQRNSTLKCLKPMLSYMNLENFLTHCKAYMWFRSNVTIALMKESNKDSPYHNFFKQMSLVYSKRK